MSNKMNFTQAIRGFTVVAMAAALVACGGGGSDSAPTMQLPTSPVASATEILTFASSEVGAKSGPQMATLSNEGTSPLKVSAIDSSNTAFKITGGTCTVGVTVMPNSSCTVVLDFAPTLAGVAKGTLTIGHNAAPSVSAVSLMGYATAALQVADAYPTAVAADCPRLMSYELALANLSISGADMQQVSDILKATSPNFGYQLFVRAPSTLMWWVRSQGGPLNLVTIGAAIHETSHHFDFEMMRLCSSDKKLRMILDGDINITDSINGDKSTANYSIAAETVPESLKTGLRFDEYIAKSASVSGNDFAVMLSELNAYTGAAEFEFGLLSSPVYSPLMPRQSMFDVNLGGQVDFMLYTLAYLKSARLNYPATYTAIQGQPKTIAYMQRVWSRAEANLVAMYPYTTNSGKGNMIVSKDALAAIYSPGIIAELDSLGITHKPYSAWSENYLR